MIDCKIALHHFQINTSSVVAAVQDVRNYAEEEGDNNRMQRLNDFLDKVFGIRLTNSEVDGKKTGDAFAYGITIAQSAVEHAIKHNCKVEDVGSVFEAAKLRADKIITKPSNGWMFAVAPPQDNSVGTVAVAQGIDVKVAVKADGTIKKGGKRILAAALYQKYVIEATEKPTNKWFKALLCKEIQLTAAGASTYAHDCDAPYHLLIKETK